MKRGCELPNAVLSNVTVSPCLIVIVGSEALECVVSLSDPLII